MANYYSQIEEKPVLGTVAFGILTEREKKRIGQYFPNVGVLMKATQHIFPTPFLGQHKATARNLYIQMMKVNGIQIGGLDGSFDHLLRLHNQRAVLRSYDRK